MATPRTPSTPTRRTHRPFQPLTAPASAPCLPVAPCATCRQPLPAPLLSVSSRVWTLPSASDTATSCSVATTYQCLATTPCPPCGPCAPVATGPPRCARRNFRQIARRLRPACWPELLSPFSGWPRRKDFGQEPPRSRIQSSAQSPADCSIACTGCSRSVRSRLSLEVRSSSRPSCRSHGPATSSKC